MNRLISRYWKTGDLYLAAYLFARSGIIVGIQADESKVVFTFLDSLKRQNLMDEFRSGKPLIDARIYTCAIRTLKHKAIDALMEDHGED